MDKFIYIANGTSGIETFNAPNQLFAVGASSISASFIPPSDNSNLTVALGTGETSGSIFTINDLNRFNKIVYNHQDILTHTSLYEKLKTYEHKFNKNSKEFHEEWEKGILQSRPEFYEWNSIYKVLHV